MVFVCRERGSYENNEERGRWQLKKKKPREERERVGKKKGEREEKNKKIMISVLFSCLVI